MTLTQLNKKEGYSVGERTTRRTSAKGQERLTRHGSGEAIITKKHFVPEKFLPRACSYEGHLNSRQVHMWAMS